MNDDDSVYVILEQTQLEKFWPKIRDDLQISRLSHFNYVKPKDLENIGISKPAIRRLLDHVKKVQLINAKKLKQPRLDNGQPGNYTIKQSQNSAIHTQDDNYSNTPSFIINENDLQISNTILGTGNFGIVKKAIWKAPSGEKINVAIKFLKEELINESTTTKQQFNNFLSEVSFMCSINHRNLVKLYGIVLSTAQTNRYLMIVTELAPLGSLLNHLIKNQNNLLLTVLYSYFQQISSGLEYLESNNMIHCDLAARNILLFLNDRVKICDFGMMRRVKDINDLYTIDANQKIPYPWYPPECLRERKFSIKSDVWAFGITLWEVCQYGKRPWNNMTSKEILECIEINGERLGKPDICSKKLYEIMNLCWIYEASGRPTFKYLTKLLREIYPNEMKAKQSFNEANKLEVEAGDTITIIDGYNDRHWWKGQNNRTLKIGYFPRLILDPQRRVSGLDISLPLRNSFIHTGHMGADAKKVWGYPDKIDEIFLSNPLLPPDLLGNIDDDLNENVLHKPIEAEKKSINSVSRDDTASIISTQSTNTFQPLYMNQSETYIANDSAQDHNHIITKIGSIKLNNENMKNSNENTNKKRIDKNDFISNSKKNLNFDDYFYKVMSSAINELRTLNSNSNNDDNQIVDNLKPNKSACNLHSNNENMIFHRNNSKETYF